MHMPNLLKIGDHVSIRGLNQHESTIVGFITDRGIFTSVPFDFVSVLSNNTTAAATPAQQFTVHKSMIDMVNGQQIEWGKRN